MKRTKRLDADTLLLWCRGCEQYLPFQEFRENSSEFGYATKCFDCELYHPPAEPFKNSNLIKQQNDRQRANEILTMLGYDIESPEPIHKQFEKKHNL
jgi:hypothetical protein